MPPAGCYFFSQVAAAECQQLNPSLNHLNLNRRREKFIWFAAAWVEGRVAVPGSQMEIVSNCSRIRKFMEANHHPKFLLILLALGVGIPMAPQHAAAWMTFAAYGASSFGITKPHDLQDAFGDTALHRAAAFGHVDTSGSQNIAMRRHTDGEFYASSTNKAEMVLTAGIQTQ